MNFQQKWQWQPQNAYSVFTLTIPTRLFQNFNRLDISLISSTNNHVLAQKRRHLKVSLPINLRDHWFVISKQNAQVLSPLLHLLSLSHEESSSELVMSSAYRKATSGSSLSFNLEGLILMGYLELLAFKVSRYPF